MVMSISEQLTRLFLISVNERRKFAYFDEIQHRKSLESFLIPLMEAYRNSRKELQRLLIELREEGKTGMSVEEIMELMEEKGIYISPYEPEITAYAVIMGRQGIEEISKIYDSFKEMPWNPLLDSKEIQKSLKITTIINNGEL